MSSYEIGDYNKGGFQAFVGTMVVTLVFFIYIAFIHPGVDLKELEAAKDAAQSAETSAGETAKDGAGAEE